MNYYYVGAASKWRNVQGTVTDPALSPVKPEDSSSWALMVDIVHYADPNDPTTQRPGCSHSSMPYIHFQNQENL